MNTTLVIMAAGIGSRFGTGIKQLTKVDNYNHIIMDYSIHDAIEAGFNKIIFVIRRDIEEEFKEVIGDRISEICAKHNVVVQYAYQAIDHIPGQLPEGRTKPWGTGHAVLACKELIDGPFAVINADDYYGKSTYKILHDSLQNGEGEFSMMGFVLKNTLSENGHVTRGICKVQDGYLTGIDETKGIYKTETGAEVDGKPLDVNSIASMNMWGFTKEFIAMLEDGFKDFFRDDVPGNPLKSEFLIPVFIGSLIEKNEIKVRALKTDSSWCGMTYQEDIPKVKDWFNQMIIDGQYNEDLYSDL